MIKRIELENFFSFGEKQSLDLNSGVNILVGINGSGKSNFLKAITFLAEGIREGGSIQRLINSWGGFDSVCNYNGAAKDVVKLCFEFDRESIAQSIERREPELVGNPVYEIEIQRVGSNDYALKERVSAKSIIGTYISKSSFVYLEMNSGKGYLRELIDDPKNPLSKVFSLVNYEKPGELFNGRELVVNQLNDPKRYPALRAFKLALQKLAVYNYFNTSFSSEIRKYQPDTIDTKLQPNGQNLFSIIQSISRNALTDFEKLEETLKQVNPAFKNIRLDSQNGRLGVVLAETNLTRTVPIESISDGTLQFLLLMAIFYNPARGNVVCLDEPDKGLHPDMIRLVADMMNYAVNKGTQIFISTHNPLLLNSFELDDLWLFEKDELNQTIIKSKNEEDLGNWVDNFLPGDLWLRGLIGARRRA